MKSSSLSLGDKLEALIELTVPDQIIENFTSPTKEGGCGCGKRKEALNNLI